MAKKKVLKTGELPDIMDMVKSVDDKTEILSESENAKILDWISTGNYLLNACISGSIMRGLPLGRIVAYYGAASSGKSFLSCAAVAQAIKKGFKVLYLDSEGAMSADFLDKIAGKGASKHVMIRPVEEITETTQILTNILDKLLEQKEEYGECSKLMIVLDSLGDLSDSSEIENAKSGENKANLQKNKLIKNMFRIITPKISAAQNCFMIVVSHSYQSMSMFSPGNIISGGCLAPDIKVNTSDGYKMIKNVKVGDMVLSHDNNYHRVLKTWNFTKPAYKISFSGECVSDKNANCIDDAYLNTEFICSKNHRFLTDLSKVDIDDGWISAEELYKIVNDLDGCFCIYAINNNNYVQYYIDGIEYVGEIPVCDLTVEDTHTYVSENGVINHNSGIQYNASVMLELFPSKLVDKENDERAKNTKSGEDNVKNGIIITAKCAKNRFARPKKVTVLLPFYKPMNPYCSLEKFMTWDNSGVCRGTMLTDKEWEKAGGDSNTIHSWEFDGQTLHCQEKDTARGIIVKHLGCQVPFTEFFTPKVFTDEILQKLDDEVIRPEFELPSQDSYEDIEEISDSIEVGSEVHED